LLSNYVVSTSFSLQWYRLYQRQEQLASRIDPRPRASAFGQSSINSCLQFIAQSPGIQTRLTQLLRSNGGYALASDFLTVRKSSSLSFDEAATLPICFLSAYIGISPYLNPGETIYIPGGGGGVGHLAIQLAARALGAGSVISSGSKPDTMALAKKFGAEYVFNYRTEVTVEKVNEFTDGKGVDLVFDATYSETGFAESARTVRPGGKWVVLGVGPGKTSRTLQTESPVDSILAGKGAQHINANLLRYFSDAELKTPESNRFLANGMQLAIQLAEENKVKPYIGKTIQGTVEEINRELNEMREGRGPSGKVAVQLAYRS
jgi:NADPH:quinone reductase-like Zn-dependent oxidoreductase